MYTIKYASKRNLQMYGHLTNWYIMQSFLTEDLDSAQAQADDLNNQSDYYTYEVKELES